MIAVLVSMLLGLTAGWAPAVASAPLGEPTTTTTPPPVEAPNIIPEPNSGRAPEDSGDPGGALQTAVFVLIVGGVVVIAALVVRESREKRAERGF